ncbi:hypothetical protein ES288_A03G263200v1 [Gossypium darwinii]|uniref:Water stress and hypersensitive response domain-containing protein n=1 Tax=Gossypium darwinii TaxID=34276 RepID=A0A5D2H8H9_GOSDA|nr:hypothetical protein ES288_A03G263200v1 [Gossypium darwinii]
MSSSDKPELVERDVFFNKVKGSIHDVGEKMEETIGFGKPTADVAEIHLPCINLEKAEIVVDVIIKNPNPVPIPSSTLTTSLKVMETVKIPVTLIYDDNKSTYDDIKPGSIIPFRLKVDLIVDVPVFGRLTLPLEKTGEIPIPYKPDIDMEKIHFERFSWEETIAVLHLKLENKNDFDLGLNALDYEVWLSEVSIGSAELEKSAKIDKNGIRTGYSMKGHINVDTPFGAMKLPISKEGGTTRLKKNREDGGDDDDDEIC